MDQREYPDFALIFAHPFRAPQQFQSHLKDGIAITLYYHKIQSFFIKSCRKFNSYTYRESVKGIIEKQLNSELI